MDLPEAQQPLANEPPFIDTPLLQAKRAAFDYPSQGNLDALISAATSATQEQIRLLTDELRLVRAGRDQERAELERVRADLEATKRERDEARYHERENAVQAVWFEDALGCKDMPLGTDSHKAAQEKLRDLIAQKANLEERSAIAEVSERILAQVIVSIGVALGLPTDGSVKPPEIVEAVEKLVKAKKPRKDHPQASLELLHQEIHDLQNILHAAGFEKFDEIPTEEGCRSISLREQIEQALANIKSMRLMQETVKAERDQLRDAFVDYYGGETIEQAITRWNANLAAARERIEVLEGALRPFVTYFETLEIARVQWMGSEHEPLSDSHRLLSAHSIGVACDITAGQFREAKAALATQSESEATKGGEA